MKRYKKILMIWICAIVVVAVSVIVALYDNANQGQDVAKEVAVETLRKVAERVVNREFDGLGMFYASGSDGGKKHTKRKAISEDGEFEVIIDSLKEAQGLFPLDVVGFKADMLNYYGKFPLEEICLEWKAEMNDRYGGAMCALFLKVNPMGKGIVQESSTGDETIIASQNDLGTYYLNGMYTMRLTAYMLPDFWHCVDWADHVLQILSCILCILLLGLAIYVGGQQYRKRKTADTLTKSTYRFGKYIFDSVNHTLTYEGEKVSGIRIVLEDDIVSEICVFDPLTGVVTQNKKSVTVSPASHFVTSKEKLEEACNRIEKELKERLQELKNENKLIEEQRLRERTNYDLEMLRETGFCNGVENYSRHLALRDAGETPSCLIDFFPKDFLLVVDESHVTLPQVRGMYNGDRMRKQTLVDYGFRLPSALDNRPLKFEEFEEKINQAIYVSATPGDYELERTNNKYVEQIIRPTGLLDPIIEVRKTEGQIDDIISEINERIKRAIS